MTRPSALMVLDDIDMRRTSRHDNNNYYQYRSAAPLHLYINMVAELELYGIIEPLNTLMDHMWYNIVAKHVYGDVATREHTHIVRRLEAIFMELVTRVLGNARRYTDRKFYIKNWVDTKEYTDIAYGIVEYVNAPLLDTYAITFLDDTIPSLSTIKCVTSSVTMLLPNALFAAYSRVHNDDDYRKFVALLYQEGCKIVDISVAIGCVTNAIKSTIVDAGIDSKSIVQIKNRMRDQLVPLRDMLKIILNIKKCHIAIATIAHYADPVRTTTYPLKPIDRCDSICCDGCDHYNNVPPLTAALMDISDGIKMLNYNNTFTNKSDEHSHIMKKMRAINILCKKINDEFIPSIM